MKKIYILLLAAICLSGNAWADEVTASDGTYLKQELPMHGYNGDAAQHNQFILKASELTAMNGKVVTAIKFYLEKQSYTWKNTAPVATFRFAEVETTTLSGLITVDETFTKVFEGLIVFEAGEWNIELATPYTYNGGNLLVDVQTTAAGYVNSNSSTGSRFYSAEADYGGCYNGTVRYYVPKTTFTYEAPGACAKPDALTRTGLDDQSASFSWAAGSDETSWQYICLPAADAVDWESESVVTTSTAAATVTGLTAQTEYQFCVRAICSGEGYGSVASATFKTECGAVTSLPYTCGFETADGFANGAYHECWNKIGSPAAYNYYTKSGSLCLRVNGTETQYVILPRFEKAVKDLQISFWYRHYYPSSYESNLVLGSMTNPADAETFTAIKALDKVDSYVNILEEMLASAPAADHYIAFKYTGANSSSAAMLDDITVEQAPSCKKPTDVVVLAKTTTTAQISWTANSDETAWVLQTSADGDSWSNDIAADANPFTLTDLSASTKYFVRVKASCSDEDQSDWADVINFTTDCDNISTLPWSENFNDVEAGALPACWDVDKANGTGQAAISVYAGDFSLSLDSKALRFNGKNTQDSAYAILPPFEAALNTLQIQFSHKAESASSSGKIELGYMKDGKFYLLKAYDQSTTMKEEDAFALTAAEGGDYIAFRYMSNSSWEYANVIDDITVSLIPNCPNPTELKVSEVADKSATVAWVSDAAKFALQLKDDEGEWTDVNALITDTFYVLTNLNEQTTYQVRVKAICEDLESEWVESEEFTTKCSAKELGYEETFSAELDACWNNSTHTGSYKWAPYSEDEQDYSLRYATGNGNGSATLVSPAIELPNEGEPVLLFYWKNTGVANVTLTVSDGTNQAEIGEELNEVTGDNDSELIIKKFNLSEFNGKKVTFTFFAEGDASTKNKYCFIDNFKVCQKPYSLLVPGNLEAAATEDGAVVVWTAAWDEPAWDLQYGPKNANKTQVPAITEKTYTITGLAEGEYEVQVRAAFAAEPSAWSEAVTFEVIKTVTAISNTVTKAIATKRIVNGQLIIERDGEQYNAQGVSLK